MVSANGYLITSSGITKEVLPTCCGVYRFFSATGELLYIGKSIDIRSRVATHFQEAKTPGRHQRIMQQVHRIDCQTTAGETGALLLENAAIKAETPLYNRRQRKLQRLSSIILRSNAAGFLQPSVIEFLPAEERNHDTYGLYQNRRHAENTLRRHARDNGLCLRVMGLERGCGPCFQYQLKRCNGACSGNETAEEHNVRLLSALDRDRIAAWPFTGPLTLVERSMEPLDDQPTVQFHYVDQWMWLGCFSEMNINYTRLIGQKKAEFDRDTYRILSAALRKSKLEILDAKSGKPVDNPLMTVTENL